MKGRKRSQDGNDANKKGSSPLLSFHTFWKVPEGGTVRSRSPNPSQPLLNENHRRGRMGTANRRDGAHGMPCGTVRLAVSKLC